MKKLLSLLSVLTISGTAIPTTIAASGYKKEETIKNKINYLQSNNLKNLNINKRNNNSPENESPILHISGSVHDFFKDLCKIIEYLQRNDIIRTIRGQVGAGDPENPISCGIDGHTPRENYFINPNSIYNYFIVPVVIEHNEQSQMIRLVFSSRNFYLTGFINNGNYYYFNEENNLDNISGYIGQRLNFNGSYGNLIGSNANPQITWSGIEDAFFNLSNIGGTNAPSEDILKASLFRVVLSTSESMRFRDVQNLIINSVSSHTFPGIPVYWQNNFKDIVKDWSKTTKDAINHLNSNHNLISFDKIHSILVFTYLIANYFNSCNTRNAGDLNNNEYCFNVPERVFHYDETNKEDKIIFHESQLGDYANYYIHTFNLGKINSVENYKKIEFIGDVHSDCWGARTEWGSWNYNNESECDTTKVKGRSIKKFLEENNNNLSSAITEGKITRKNSWNEIENAAKIYLQSFNDWDSSANILVSQKFGLTYYFDEEDKNYYLQVICYQNLNWWASSANLIGKIKIGNGIGLFN
ncbi:ribosome-inactivating family protein [Spiroplasma endosymbiont of Megaselia nigra]|uniref:ribosome-inactivating family protein n=1 Tax=Spiroplasma endosymbiont of Megaselia nigra TaxID=2478537 RepID=UPI000F8765D5|nr:ribosome-inactivating family protein [Spiroplasma endosymbiont of Megaselia nigra]